jgi:hypothetical protein
MARTRKLPPGMWKRGTVYYARFRHKGIVTTKRLSADFDVAKTLLNELRVRADRADFGIVGNDYLWDDLKAEFLRWARQSVRNPEVYERDLRHFEKYSRVQSVRQVTPTWVVGYREWRLSQSIRAIAGQTLVTDRTVSPRTVNREVATLQNMLNKAVAWNRIGSNPLTSFAPLDHDSPRKQRRALAVEEGRGHFPGGSRLSAARLPAVCFHRDPPRGAGRAALF